MRSATGASQDGRTVNVYRHVALVPSPSGANVQPPPNDAKNQGPLTIRIPTWLGRRKDTYSETIRNRCRETVAVRTPWRGLGVDEVLGADERIPAQPDLAVGLRDVECSLHIDGNDAGGLYAGHRDESPIARAASSGRDAWRGPNSGHRPVVTTWPWYR